MAVTAVLLTPDTTVEPGNETMLELRVRNLGAITDDVVFQPVGTAEGWIELVPPEVTLYPGAEETVHVWLRPPRSAEVLAGPTPFGIRAVPREDPDGSVTAEGTVDVLPYDDRRFELVPAANRGGSGATYQAALANQGNVEVESRFEGDDPSGELTITFDPPAVRVPPGGVGFSRVKVTPHRTYWRGDPQNHPFQVRAVEDERVTLTAEGLYLQEQRLPRGLAKALAIGLGALAVVALLWFVWWKPQMEQIAQDAADEAAEQTVRELETRIAAATGTALPPLGATPSTTASLGQPFDFRLTAGASVGSEGSSEYPIPDGQSFSLTDLVLQNPNGDTGRLRVLRDGDILLEVGLENFRDLTYHFVAPFDIGEGQSVVLQLTCLAPGAAGGDECTAGATASGYLKAVGGASPTTTEAVTTTSTTFTS